MTQGPGINHAGEIDEHDLPTEPLPDVPGGVAAIEATIPVPQPGPPFQQQMQGAPQQYPYHPQQPPGAQSYPYLPAAPIGQTGNGAQRARTGYPLYLALLLRGLQRTPLPLCVGLFFVMVQLLLLVRFVLRILNLSADTAWVGVVYGISSAFVLPFQLLLQQAALPFPTIELSTLLAVLCYGLISRVLVHVLKAFAMPRRTSG